MKLLIFSLLSLSLLFRITSQACQQTCGKQPIKYPFGTGPGCGDPRFQKYITCSQNQLTLATHTGCYPITSVDYSSQTIYVYDPTMSTCACTQASRGFSLDWDAPFTFHDNTIFALLDCSTSSLNATSVYCDPNGASVCSLLNSCRAISKLDSPVSTCCVYDPVVLGPTFEMDLQKLQCGSYSGIYGYNGKNSDAYTWSYGVAIKYKFNFNNDYPSICGDCEKSNGTCGYYGKDNSFVCYCSGGVNTSANCFFATPWNSELMSVPPHTGAWFIYNLALYLLLM